MKIAFALLLALAIAGVGAPDGAAQTPIKNHMPIIDRPGLTCQTRRQLIPIGEVPPPPPWLQGPGFMPGMGGPTTQALIGHQH